MRRWRRAYFNVIAPGYAYFRRPSKTELTTVFTLLSQSKPQSFLDVGAGPGYHAAAILQSFPDAQLTVVEPSAVFRALCRWQVQRSGCADRFTCLPGEAERLPLPDGSCEAALCLLVLWAVPNRARALAELTRVLAPNGTLVVGEFFAPPGAGQTQRLPFGHPPLRTEAELEALLAPTFRVTDTRQLPGLLLAACRKNSLHS